MKKFVFVYYGGGMPDDVPKEEAMAEWGKWFESLGKKLVDGGNPFDDGGQEVSADGVTDISRENSSSGYTIVNADSMEQAVEIAKDCPMHKHTKGRARVRVYEALPM